MFYTPGNIDHDNENSSGMRRIQRALISVSDKSGDEFAGIKKV